MVARIATVSFQGFCARDVDVQVQIAPQAAGFQIVGLPDKAVAESKERVRSALDAIGLGLPFKRITVNLSPADLPKEGSHYDLPIALGLLTAMDVLPADEMSRFLAIGELALDGQIAPVAGVLPAGVAAAERGRGLICPAACGGEAAWAGDLEIIAARDLLAIVNHFKGTQVLQPPEPGPVDTDAGGPDLRDIKGQESAKRALEIAAAGGHNMLMMGPPGSGKSMLAARMPGLLPPLSPMEALEVSMIRSLAGELNDGRLSRRRPFRNPHHSTSTPALVGGGLRVKPGEISLAHRGVLFLDELPEFPRPALEALRQPLETAEAVVARANAHVTYPARVQLVAAMNPCRCGHLDDAERACSRAPKCSADYQAKISGPLIDRIDIVIDVPAVAAADLALPPAAEGSEDVAARVLEARRIQWKRGAKLDIDARTNAEVDGEALLSVATPDAAAQALLTEAADRLKLSARGYNRVIRVARTIADLAGAETIGRPHIAEALTYRRRGAVS